MIGIQTSGRLGNQLFQFAFLYACHLEHKEPFFVTRYGKLKYFETGFSKFQNQINLLKSLYLFRKGYFDPRSEFSDKDLYPRADDSKQIYFPHSLYTGYFQSFNYFERYQEEIKSCFRIKKRYKIKKFDFQYCAIHIRKGDYKNISNELLGSDISLEKDYYLKSINKLDLSKNVKLIFVTDDPKWVHQNFKEVKSFSIISGSEISDFQILINADYLVLSNSSFSWWAAFLSGLEGSRIISPLYWMGWKTQNLYPPFIYNKIDWKKL